MTRNVEGGKEKEQARQSIRTRQIHSLQVDINLSFIRIYVLL